MIVALLMAAALTDPEGVVSTAPAGGGHVPASEARPAAAPQDPTPHRLTTQQQIDRWLSAPAPARTEHAPIWADEPEQRRIHGEIGAGIGTEGYRSMYGSVTVPIGEEGSISLFYSDTKNDVARYYGDGRYDIYDRVPRGQTFDVRARRDEAFGAGDDAW